MTGDDGQAVTLADLYPGDIVAIEPDDGTNVPYLVVQLGSHMGVVGKGKNKRPTWHLITTLDLDTLDRYPETWRPIDTDKAVVLDLVAAAPWMRELRQMNKRFRIASHDPRPEFDPLMSKPTGEF